MRLFRTIMVAAACLLITGNANADGSWPKGTIKLVIPAKAGGGTDIMGRIFANYLQQTTGSAVAVINQPSGGGTVGYEMVRTAKPDGQTLLYAHTSLLINAHTGRYPHSLSDFTPIAYAQIYPPQVYAVAPNAPWNNLKDFVNDARNNPGKLTIGVSLGGTTHFIAGLMQQAENIELKMVEASSEVDKVAAIQGGHIDIGNLGAKSARQFVEAGKMKPLALLDPVPNKSFPEFPTAIEQGVNVFWQTPLIVFGPKDMDPAIVQKINEVTKGMSQDPTIQESLEKMSSSYNYHPVEEVQKLLEAEDQRISKIAEQLGIAPK
ncbi:tripartite tricarboxylate transporter substrate binding protein [uncultured Cohaesibacter sp.]|uniref:Bug family tripartite tricarboxylate transporter substrate binding protein n=1 Tax=uncultured Cohaesibacter sp. TaxID=1002546 RepID=UPI00292D73BD|nr:tripartite tricarboxylate transporter substrate binding protein [uncultured Cohaesibacter sp.]